MPGRRERLTACAELAERAARDCWAGLERRDVGAVVKQLRTRLLEIGEREGQRTAGKLAARMDAVPAGALGAGNVSDGPDEGEAGRDADRAGADEIARLLDEHTHRLINKIMHLPLSRIDPGVGHEAELDGGDLGALCRLFGLDELEGGGEEKVKSEK